MADPTGATPDVTPPVPDQKSAGADANAGNPTPKPADAGADEGSVIADAGSDKEKGKPEGDAKPKDEKPQGAPEKYEPFKIQDGLPVDEELLKQFSEQAKVANLTQDQAQKVVDYYGTLQKQQQDLFKQTTAEWKAQTLKSLGPTPEKELVHAAKGRDAFFTPEAVKILSDSGLGNHPEIVRAFIKIGKAIADDTVVDGGKGGGEGKTHAQILYPAQGK